MATWAFRVTTASTLMPPASKILYSASSPCLRANPASTAMTLGAKGTLMADVKTTLSAAAAARAPPSTASSETRNAAATRARNIMGSLPGGVSQVGAMGQESAVSRRNRPVAVADDRATAHDRGQRLAHEPVRRPQAVLRVRLRALGIERPRRVGIHDDDVRVRARRDGPL